VTSRTGERAEAPATDRELTDPELADLGALYARHAPDLRRGDQLPLLLAAARGHVELARMRVAGEPLIRVRQSHEGGEARPVVEVVTDDMPFLAARSGGPGGRRGRAGDPPDRRRAAGLVR
jgi:glutamate dehydrogenase